MSNNTKKPQASVMLVFPGPDGRRYRIVSFVGEVPRRVLSYVLDEEREDTVGDKYWQKTTMWTPSTDEKLVDVLMSAIVHLMNPNALIANDAELEGKRDDAAMIMALTTAKLGALDGPRRVLVAGVDFPSSLTHVGALPAGTRICSRCEQYDPIHTRECEASETAHARVSTLAKLQATCRRCDLQFAHPGSPSDVTTTCPECRHSQAPNFTTNAPQCDYSRCRRSSGHAGNHVDQQGEPIMCASSCGRPAGHGGKCHEAHP